MVQKLLLFYKHINIIQYFSMIDIYNFPGSVKRNEVENYLTKLQQTNPVPKLQEVQIEAELSLQSTDNFN